MRVLILHNHYEFAGGEDAVVRAETEMLRQADISVELLETNNSFPGAVSRLRAAWNAPWSRSAYDLVSSVCRKYRPHVVHVHNFWLHFSPSVLAAARESGAATVQTLHNFRLLCANSLLLRKGVVCMDCLGRSPWRGMVRRCYRDSWAASAAVGGMIIANRARHTWEKHVDAFIALSESSRAIFEAGAIPASKLFVKPNFVADAATPMGPPSASRLIVCAGRLSPEKGFATVLSAWAMHGLDSLGSLQIFGDGPSRGELLFEAGRLNLRGVLAGPVSPMQVRSIIAQARAVVVPSLCLENFPTIVAEAYAAGRPVIASEIGALGEIVADGRTGLKFEPGAADELADRLKTILQLEPLADELGRNSRREYLLRYTPQRNLDELLKIYRFALESRGCEIPTEVASRQHAPIE